MLGQRSKDRENLKGKLQGIHTSTICNADDLMKYLLTAAYEMLSAAFTIKECGPSNCVFVAWRMRRVGPTAVISHGNKKAHAVCKCSVCFENFSHCK